jgi:small ligand-binding sensory domain FIST
MAQGSISAPDFAIAFCTDEVDAERFLAGLKAAVGANVPVIGGSAIGVITNETISYTGSPACVGVVQAEQVGFKVAFSEGLHRDPRAAGAQLVANLAPRDREKLLLVLYDSVRQPATPSEPPVLNPSGPLIEGLTENLGPGCITVGAGLIGSFRFGPTRQFCLDRAASQAAVGLTLSDAVHPYHRIFHGCTPLDGIYHAITRMEGDQIYEIDHEPAVTVIDHAYGSQNWRQQRPVNLITLGVNCGQRYDAPQEAHYVNRLITGVLPDDKGIRIFEPDLAEGMDVQFMLRDPEKMIESAQHHSADLIDQVLADHRRPVCGIYIDCAGRNASFANTSIEEAALVQDAFNRYDIPLLGFYSGVEIAPLMGKSRGLDWTGVLIVIAEE